MRFVLAPAAIPAGYGESILPLAEAKAWCRVDHEDDDDLIAALRDSAVDMVEQYCCVRLAPQTGLLWRAEYFATPIRLRVGPLTAVTAVDYLDGDGAAQTVDPATLRHSIWGEVRPKAGEAWPCSVSGGVSVTFSAGFTDENRPSKLVLAAKMFCATLYDRRDEITTGGAAGALSFGFRALCDQHRFVKI